MYNTSHPRYSYSHNTKCTEKHSAEEVGFLISDQKFMCMMNDAQL